MLFNNSFITDLKGNYGTSKLRITYNFKALNINVSLCKEELSKLDKFCRCVLVLWEKLPLWESRHTDSSFSQTVRVWTAKISMTQLDCTTCFCSQLIYFFFYHPDKHLNISHTLIFYVLIITYYIRTICQWGLTSLSCSMFVVPHSKVHPFNWHILQCYCRVENEAPSWFLFKLNPAMLAEKIASIVQLALLSCLLCICWLLASQHGIKPPTCSHYTPRDEKHCHLPQPSLKYLVHLCVNCAAIWFVFLFISQNSFAVRYSCYAL